ncbi:phosphoenolpyruvate--protein phosphotransferase [Magnetovirga frankeli]|uniref:phosphoenolpyruvate--protein phosphotransferase n=1 Tax=Magnetovirga frankeli TaxID=947516 RepID=UPI001293AD5A|nr:phosphoenolpyruvate--protein phosphotransferase [gamma proteobacterium SS-5]
MLETLRRIVQEVNDAPNLRAALEVIVQRVKVAVKADVCSVYLTDFDKGRHVLRASDGLRPEAVDRVHLALHKGLIGLVCDRAEPINLQDATSHPNYRFIPETGEQPYNGFLGVPIIQHRRVLGVLVAQQREQRRFAEDEATFLLTLASQLAGAITHANASGELAAMQAAKRRQKRFMTGRPSASGVGIGTAVVAFRPAELRLVPDRPVDRPEEEVARFHAALDKASAEIGGLKQQMAISLSEEDAALFDAWAMLLRSDSLLNRVEELIQQGCWAPGALRRTIDEHCKVFESMEDAYMRERGSDIRDLGRRILSHLQHSQSLPPENYPASTILVGEEVSATQLAEVPVGQLKGIVCATGSSASHVAILARALGIPAIMGVADLQVGRLEGHELIVDGYLGRVHLQPPPSVLEEYAKLISEMHSQSAVLEQMRGCHSQTRDGERVHVYLNTGLVSETSSLGLEESEGVGLYRTELPFMVRDRFPSEEVQRNNYRRVLKHFHPRPVTLRTLDIGGDKPLPYFPINESNPFLGWRGIRISLDHPEIFLTQVRAMLRASVGLDNLRILLPMISHISEVIDAKRLIQQALDEVLQEGRKVRRPKLGVMIEVPSAVFQAEALACLVDFISLGTNDLTQYLLAVDRNNPNVGDLFSDLHPAVLKAIHQVMRDAGPQVEDISVCGEMAGNPLSAILLVGMGYRHLSMSAGGLLKIKYALSHIDLPLAQHMAASALCCEEPETVKILMERLLMEHDMLHLVAPTGAVGGS